MRASAPRLRSVLALRWGPALRPVPALRSVPALGRVCALGLARPLRSVLKLRSVLALQWGLALRWGPALRPVLALRPVPALQGAPALGWIVLGLLLSLWPALARAEQPLAAYPGAVNTRIGDDLIIAGEPYRIAYFTTDDPLPKVAAHFKKVWAEAGYPVTQSGDLEAEGVVSAFFTRQGLVRSIVLRRHGAKTLGFSVLKDVWVKAAAAAGPDPLPRLEGALYSSDLDVRGASGHSRHRSAVLGAPVQQARDARDAAWSKAGFERTRETQVRRPADARLERVLEYRRGAEQAIVTLVEVDPATSGLDETWVQGPQKAERPR